jgi:branched-chain amino acid transport system substrate-binding protein
MLLSAQSFTAIAASLLFCATASAHAQPVKIGVILPLSGPFADYGKQIGNGIKVYMKQHGDIVAGRKVELIIKDDTGVAPELDKRLALELLTRDKVDILAGFGLTPSALAVAPIATQARKPMIIMNAASAAIPSKSPYIARVSVSLPQVSAPMAHWAAKNGVKKVYTLVADYAPGIETEMAFKNAFEATGNHIIGSVRVPVSNLDFSAYMQKIKDLKPDGIFVFLPPGSATIAFVKAYDERGLKKDGIRLFGTHDLTDENLIDSLGKGIIGTITSGYYSAAHPSALNKTFVKNYSAMFGNKAKVNFMSVTGYDGMAAIYAALKKTGGDTDGTKLMSVLKGMRFESPRGMITIDSETRDIMQTIYLRKVTASGNDLANIEFDQVDNVKAPAH